MSDIGRGNPTEPLSSRPDPRDAGTGTRSESDIRVEHSDTGRGSVRASEDHRLGGTAPRRDDDKDRRDPLEAAKDPDNRAKLLLAAVALTLLNTILLAVLLANVLGDGAGEEVVVDGVPCIVADAGDGEQTLYCQR